MSDLTENFIKGSDNTVSITLTEDETAFALTPTEISVVIGDVVTITRSPSGAGLSYSGGVLLDIVPRTLTEDLSALGDGSTHRVKVVVKTSSETSGIVFGDDDYAEKLYFKISSNPV
jgi:hypothetical protein